MVTMVTTTIGDVMDVDLEFITTEVDEGQVINAAREWFYVGKDPTLADYVGKMVRRDVWTTIKSGHSMSGQQGA